MCALCENRIYTRDEVDNWLLNSSYDDTMPRNIIYKGTVNNYLYSKVEDHNYNEETVMLIHYCPVCGEELI